MEWIEVTGKSVDEAVLSATDTLGVSSKELEFEVISESKKGVFGIGGNEARIKARVKPISREKPRDKKRSQTTRKLSGNRKPAAKNTQTKSRQPKKEETKMDDSDTETIEETQEETKRTIAFKRSRARRTSSLRRYIWRKRSRD